VPEWSSGAIWRDDRNGLISSVTANIAVSNQHEHDEGAGEDAREFNAGKLAEEPFSGAECGPGQQGGGPPAQHSAFAAAHEEGDEAEAKRQRGHKQGRAHAEQA